MMKNITAVIILCSLWLTSFSQDVYYIRTQQSGSWDTNFPPDPIPGYMNTVFGNGNWATDFYETLTPANIFSCTTRMVYLEGGDNGANELNALLAANASLIENWVSIGGQLLINAAPNEGGNINAGFGGVLITYSAGTTSSGSASVTAGQGAHPVFNGPNVSGSSWTGSSFAHAILSGGGITNLITGSAGVVMAEKSHGVGKVLFGTMTWPIGAFQSPQPGAVNLRLNMLSYLNQNLSNCAAINSVSVSQTTYCAGSNIAVDYTTTPTFFAGNIFVAQLSDASGSFSSPLNIGSLASTTDGTINAVIPNNITFGTGYRVRVISNNPVRVGPDNGVNITINPKPVANFGFSLGCAGEPVSFRDSSTITSGSLTSYTYGMGDGGTSNLANPVYAYPLSGVYNITLTVTSNAGCSDTKIKTLTVNPTPVADFSVNNVCIGSSTTFVNSSSGATGFLWKFGDGNTSTAISPNFTYANPGTYTATFIVSNAAGCTDSIQKNVTIYPEPVADFSFVSACPNSAVQFTNLSTVSGGSLASAWTFGDGNSSNATNPSNTYIFSTSYNVRLIVTSDFSCRDTITKPMAVYPVPLSGFNVQNVCFGNPSLFQNTTTITSGALSFIWNFGDSTSSIASDPIKNYDTIGLYNVTLTATSDKGCVSSVTKQHRVFDQPVAGFTAPNVCLGDSTQFTNNTVGTSVTFQWSFGDGFFSAAANPKHKYNAAGTYNARLISRNISGCADTITHTVAVYPQPVAAFTGSNVCYGNTIQFSNFTTIGSGTLNYTWNFGDGTGSYNPAPVKNYASPGTYSVQLLAVSDNGCKDSLSQSFSVFPQPVAGFTAANVCFGDTVLFINNSQGAGVTYQWNFGDNTTDTVMSPKHFYAAAGTYNVQLIVSNGSCADTVTKSLSVYPEPVSAFSSADVCFGMPVVFTNQSTISQGTLNYQWTFGDGTGSNNPSPTHTYQSIGSYTVTLVANSSNGCTDTSSLVVNVYPQPVADFMAANVCFGNAVAFQNSSTSIGNSVFTWYFGDGDTSHQVAVSHVYNAPGTYTVSLSIVNTNGCRDSILKTVTVYPTPVADFTVSNVCLGNVSDFVNLTTINNSTLSYGWNFGDGNTSSDINPDYTYDSIGIYNVTLVATGNDGCADTISKTNAIFPYPVAGFSANVACYGQPVTFSNSTTIEFGTVSYQWSFGDGGTDTDDNPQHAYNSLGVFSVNLTATSDRGCTDQTQQFITVYPFPTVNFSALPVCENDTVRFTNLSFISSGNLNYYWQFGDGSSSLMFEPQHVYTDTSGNIPVTLIATSNFGCADTITKNAVIYPAPDVDFTFRNSCFGESVKLTNTSSVSGGNIKSIFWNFGDTEVSQQTSPEKIYAAPGTYNISLTVESNRGCVDSAVKAVIVYPLPDATIRPLGRHPFCYGDSVILSAGSLIDTYVWSTGDSTRTITINYADYFSVTVTSVYGCTATDGFNTIVYSLPPANAGNDTTISKGFDAYLNGSGGIIYEWSPTETLSDANISNPVASPLETTTYTITVTDENQCRNFDDVIVTVLEDYLLLVTNVITPNEDGANDKFEIINIETYPEAELLIYDRWGTELYMQMPYNNDWGGTYKGKPLPDGTYYYVIRFKGVEKLYKGSVSVLR
jgi:gliding motility-associated-like protein